MNILVIAEHDHGQLKRSTLAAAGCATQLCGASGGTFDLLALGSGLDGVGAALQHCGAAHILLVDHPALAEPLADRFAAVIAQVTRDRGSTLLIGAASTFTKDVLPRAAALLDAGMLSDVVDAQPDGNDYIFKRVMFAGNAIATVKLAGSLKVISVRAAAFAAPAVTEAASLIVPVTVDAALPTQIEFLGRDPKVAGRPDATEARRVVSGGRALKNADDFERVVGGLADALGAAVGSSRALVDAGITPNSLQIGQTGKIVAPELYIALGISGAIQHMAGMKDAKVIVAINKDADAPIFEVADYGIVGDLFEVVPAIIAAVKG